MPLIFILLIKIFLQLLQFLFITVFMFLLIFLFKLFFIIFLIIFLHLCFNWFLALVLLLLILIIDFFFWGINSCLLGNTFLLLNLWKFWIFILIFRTFCCSLLFLNDIIFTFYFAKRAYASRSIIAYYSFSID